MGGSILEFLRLKFLVIFYFFNFGNYQPLMIAIFTLLCLYRMKRRVNPKIL